MQPRGTASGGTSRGVRAKDGKLPRGAYRTGTDTARGLLRTAGFDFHDPAWYTRYFDLLDQARDFYENHIQALRAAGTDPPLEGICRVSRLHEPPKRP